MSIDLSKLTPAPWLHGGLWHVVMQANRLDVVAKAINGSDRDFIALARNAFDVMMRRGWGVVPTYEKPPYDEFSVQTSAGEAIDGMFDLTWPNPFTALVEADKWYAANVETK